MNSLKFETLIEDCESDIRAGKPQEVSRRLLGIIPARVPRAYRAPLARVCRRAGLYALGMKLLSQIVLLHEPSEPTLLEEAEYACTLLRYGAVNEAQERLRRIDGEKMPQALLYLAFSHFVCWKFDDAIPVLERYLSQPMKAYDNLVGKMNLSFALIEAGLHKQAAPLLEETIEAAQKAGHVQLQSNCRALRAQSFLLQLRLEEARTEIKSALGLVSASQTNDQVFVLKWKLILDALDKKSIEPLEELRRLAMAAMEWEALREAEFYSLKMRFTNNRFMHLYFGSPYSAFRRQLATEFGEVKVPSTYRLGPSSGPCLDLRSGEVTGLRRSPKAKAKVHKVIDILLHDFYKPMRIAEIFSILYPGESFDIFSSPNRVHQRLWQARKWFRDTGLGVDIGEKDGFYSIRNPGKFSFLVSHDRRPINLVGLRQEQVKTAFEKNMEFSAKEIRQKLRLSASSAHRVIHQGLKDGSIEKIRGDHRTAVFRIRSEVKKAG